MTKHALSTRLWHWVNAAAIIVLFMSGLNISNAHRYLYWGDYGFDPKDAWLSVIKFPGWATIPQNYNLALARDWHITAAWPFGVGLLFIWIAMLMNGHFRRDLTTTPRDWTLGAVLASVRAHSGGGAAHRYNPVQRILYGMVFGVLLPLMLFTGLAISPGFQAAAPWLLDVLGGRQSARSLHFIASWAIFGFFVIHILLAITDWRLILEMFTGGRRADSAEPAPIPSEDGATAHG
ncbi:cytochrome b/b6 domain-containing protein [Porphyrobacter sp. ULC335]|uniref:cytochrome b/b6 domain-containing protein n=1 Tax=Porphyrobacter sp. ULC335 TaxID=2854260 RepID=UPI00221EA427|nr:cytochrome b/b6 domain-containing protein [Porphyrobacter sp. ULC335]UYV15096.1 cytochrome b/b6 domain-containing protein [Porphyrobacter sp. ULC335]